MDAIQQLEGIKRMILYPDIEFGRDDLEKARDALTKLFLPEFDTRGIAAFKDLRSAYIHLTGDNDINGIFKPDRVTKGLRSCMDFSSNTFAYALQNALSMYLSKVYKAFPYREEILISEKKEATDFRTIHSIQLGYFGDLPDVDPEAGDYNNLERFDDTESQYNLSPKGGIAWITRRLIINNSIDIIRAITNRMARSARMTHAKYVWNFYINNAACPDGTSWFTSGHGNLGSQELGASAIMNAITDLANLTEPGSGEKLGMDLATFNWFLVVPINRWTQAVTINNAQDTVCHKLFGDHHERIVTPSFFTDDDDWGIIRDKEDAPLVEMSYLNGHEEPEFILEEGPTQEHVFVQDKIGYKIRHECGGTLADYRGGHKSVVA